MGTVTVKLDLNKTGFSAGITDARKQARQLGDSLKDVGSHGVSQMQAASGTLRLLQGGFEGNIRAAERFLGLIPGLSAGLQAAFPIVGAIAFGGAMVKVGSEITEFISKARDMPRVITAGFESLALSAQATNDELNVTNDKIENQIAKLEHKPQNNLKLAIDEAKVSADQFAKSVEAASSAMQSLIEKNSISLVQGFLTDTAPTKALAGTIKPYEDDKTHLATQAAIGKSLGDDHRYTTNMQAFHEKEEAELNKMKTILADAQAKQAAMDGINRVYQDQTPVMTMARGVIDQIQLSRAHEQSLKTGTVDKDRQARDEAARQAAEDAKKAQDLLLKVYENQEKQQNAFNKMSLNEEIQFWNDKISAFTKGGQQYLEVQDKIYEEISKRPDLFGENKKNQAEAGRSAVEGNDLLSNAQKTLITNPAIEQMERAARANEKYNEITAAGAEIQARSTAEFRESAIAIALQQGTISKLGAAQALAAVHAKEHADALAIVNRELKTQIDLIQGDTALKGDDQPLAIRNAQAEAAKQAGGIDGTYAVTQQRDSANIYQNTGSGEAADTYRTMLQSWSDMTQNIAQAMARAADSFNDDIAKAIVGKGSVKDFGHTFSQLGESMVKTALQKGESMIFGGGQLGSSQTNPVWTRDAASAAGGSGTPNLGPFIRPFIGGQQGQGGQSGSQGGSILSKLLGAFIPGMHFGGGNLGKDSFGMPLGFQGGFASGGDVLANRDFLVGERGPELLRIGASGHVTPNSQIGRGGDTHVYHIDARGSNDPAAVHAAVARALPHAVAASVQANHQQKMRSPGGR